MNKDKILLRIKDLVLLVGAIGGILVGLGKVFVIANAVEAIEPIVRTHEKKLAVADARWEQIQNQIEAINRKLDRR